MKVKVKLNHKNINLTKAQMMQALVETAEATKSDLMESEAMPFDIGTLQNKSTYVDKSKKNQGIVSIVSDTPYARRLYYHPEYNFQTDKNAFAGGLWFETYKNGYKKNFVQNTFTRIARSKMK